MSKVAMEVEKNPALLRGGGTLVAAVCEAARNGLEVGGVRSQAYLVPYGSRVELIVGYKGLIELLNRTGKLASSTFEVVHEGDDFDWAAGDDEFIKHRPSDRADREQQPITHVYVIFRMRDGAIVRNCWPSSRIQAHKEQYSPNWQSKDSPWQTAWRQMAIKTVVRDTFGRGRLPMSESIQQYIERESQIESGTYRPTSNQDAAAIAHAIPELTPPAEPETVEPAVEEETDTFKRLSIELHQTNNLGGVTALREKYNELLGKDADADDTRDVEFMCDEREDEIRASRGGEQKNG